MIRVLIADDEDMIRTALAALLRLEDDLEVVAECRDGESALAEAERLRPDVCLLDLEMPGLDGVDTAARILRACPRAASSSRATPDPACCDARSVRASTGSSQVAPADDVAAVIREVAAGRRYVDPEIAADALSDERSPLTDRELDVLRAGARGETVAEIAAALHLSAGTVRNHVSSVLGKLGLASRQQATIHARERGWI